MPEHIQPSEQRFTSESFTYVVPLDPYSDRILQFLALSQLGYPVALQVISVEELPVGLLGDQEVEEWQRRNQPVFVRPIVVEPDFDKYIDEPDSPLELFRGKDGEFDRKLICHPRQLAAHVDVAIPDLLGHELRKHRSGRKVSFVYPPEGVDIEQLLERCFMAAFERYMEKKSRDYPFHENEALLPEDIQLYEQLLRKRQRPITPEDLGGLMVGYYQLIERLYPKFKSFKRSTAHQ